MLGRDRLLAGLLLFSLFAWVQGVKAQPTQAQALSPVQTLTLNESVLPLVGPWRFQPGDSPLAGAAPTWAASDFDDRSWNRLQLPEPGSAGEDLPGWMQRGYPALGGGYAWYRLRVRVSAPPQPLWLKMPDAYDDAFQLYANGKLLGGVGFNGPHPVAFYSRPVSFALPPPDAQGVITLALRFWLDPNTKFDNPSAGGLHAPPRMGLASTIRALQGRDDIGTILFQAPLGGFLPLFSLLAAIAALWAWIQVRRDQAYLWLALRLLVSVTFALVYDFALAGKLSQTSAAILQNVILRSLLAPGWIAFWWHWFQLRRDRWILYAALAATVLDATSALCARAVLHGTLSAHWSPWLSSANTGIKVVEIALLALILVKGFQRDRTEALFAIFPLALNEIDIFNGFNLEGWLGWDKPVLGMHIPPSAVASFVLVLTIGALSVRRFLATHARRLLAQQALEAELVQARELQERVILPDAGQSPLVRVETAYYPAQTVGGDFFQVLSAPDGTVLIVLGDVSGKGLTAAFLVAVLVGAMQTRAERSLDPLAMVQMLNARLLGRSEGHFATCLAVAIQPDGLCTFVNAGHLSPYLNGHEIEIEGTLPLGILPDAECSMRTLHLQPNDRLTLLSDGVLEAANAAGEMFGFDRTLAISQAGAQEIADTARSHGQQDDVTVITLRFVGSAQTVAAA